MLAFKTRRVSRLLGLASLHKTATTQLWLALTPLGLGLLNLTLKAFLEDADATENAIEWIATLFMQAYVVLSYFSWRDTGLRLQTTVDDASKRV